MAAAAVTAAVAASDVDASVATTTAAVTAAADNVRPAQPTARRPASALAVAILAAILTAVALRRRRRHGRRTERGRGRGITRGRQHRARACALAGRLGAGEVPRAALYSAWQKPDVASSAHGTPGRHGGVGMAAARLRALVIGAVIRGHLSSSAG